jgi:hypothetical protein
MGVNVTIDGSEVRNVSSGDVLRLDGKAHTFSFACSGDLCAPLQREVPAGDKDQTLVVRLQIKPAVLVIVGDQDKTYQLVEHPEIPVRVGSNTVTVRSAFEPVTIKQIESGATVRVRLQAGKSVQASF